MSEPRPHRLILSGTLLCAASALAYSVNNAGMRQLSVLGCDPTWAMCVKESITVFCVGAWILREAWMGRKTLPDKKTLIALILVGLLTEVVGNVGWQWAMGVVGLAVTIPSSFGMSLTGGAILGMAVLKERISLRSLAAILTIWVALGLLGVGAESVTAREDVLPWASPAIRSALGIGSACIAGIVFAILNVTMCQVVRANTKPAVLGFWITLMGVVSLGPISLMNLGPQGMLATTREQWFYMVISGIFNMTGFILLGAGLKRTTIVHANVMNASQVAIAAMVGIALFHESPNIWLVLGIGLMIAGILGGGAPHREEEAAECVVPCIDAAGLD